MGERKTGPFREQHDRILEIAEEISLCVDDMDNLRENPNRAAKLLSDLSRNLKMHLTLEDTSLYPILNIVDNKELNEVAAGYIDEMGYIKKAFDEYSARWHSGFRIKENPEVFAEETKQLLDSLTNRIEKENSGLYNMIDDLFK